MPTEQHLIASHGIILGSSHFFFICCSFFFGIIHQSTLVLLALFKKNQSLG